MLDIFLSIVLGCSGVCLAYYFLEVWGTPPEDPETQPPTDYLSEPPEEARKIWTTIK